MGDKFESILTSSSAWDATAAQYSAMAAKTQFTQGFAKDAWDAVYDKEKTKNVRVLDIACGTGALALPIAEVIKEGGGSVLATDFAPKMIECVENSVKLMKVTNIEARVEDGQDLHIPDNQFDYAFSIFGLLFFPDSNKGMREAWRVLKPGGKFAITTWTLQNIMLQASTKVMLKHNRNFTGQFLELKDKEVVKSRLTNAGFSDVKVVELSYDMAIADYQKLIDGFTTNPAYVGVREELGIDDATFQKELLEVYKEMCPTLPAKYPNVALLATGTKP